MTVAEAMQIGSRRYAPAIEHLRQSGYPTDFTQTGGMCAALQIRLERGYLLVTDVEDSLPWDPAELRGWGVGYYKSEDVSEGPLAFAGVAETTPDALIAAVDSCMCEVVRNVSSG